MSIELVLQIIGTATATTPIIFGLVYSMIRFVGSDTRTKLDLHVTEDNIQFKQLHEDIREIKDSINLLVKHLIDR